MKGFIIYMFRMCFYFLLFLLPVPNMVYIPFIPLFLLSHFGSLGFCVEIHLCIMFQWKTMPFGLTITSEAWRSWDVKSTAACIRTFYLLLLATQNLVHDIPFDMSSGHYTSVIGCCIVTLQGLYIISLL